MHPPSSLHQFHQSRIWGPCSSDLLWFSLIHPNNLSPLTRLVTKTQATRVATLCQATPRATVMINTLALGTWWIQRCWASLTSKEHQQTAALTLIPAWPPGFECWCKVEWVSKDTLGHRGTMRMLHQRRIMGNCICRRAMLLPFYPAKWQREASVI